MKKIFLLLAVVSFATPSMAQKSKKKEKSKAEAPAAPVVDAIPSPEERAANAAAMDNRQVGPMHHLMIQFAGHWRQEMKVWNGNDKKEPIVSMLEYEGQVFAEGKFINAIIRGQFGNVPYEAHSTLGFDNAKRMYTKTWIDNLGTSILVLDGTYNEKDNTIDFVGFATDPITRKPIRVHQILKMIDQSNHLLEVYVEMKEGKEVKIMEIKSTRG